MVEERSDTMYHCREQPEGLPHVPSNQDPPDASARSHPEDPQQAEAAPAGSVTDFPPPLTVIDGGDPDAGNMANAK
jgi:hypothetical protein